METLNQIIFQDKTFSNILEEVYNNQTEKKSQILNLILQLKDLIKDTGDATLLVPLIKEYLDVSVKNDDHLIKLANLIQKVTISEVGDVNGALTEEEKQQLLTEYKGILEHEK